MKVLFGGTKRRFQFMKRLIEKKRYEKLTLKMDKKESIPGSQVLLLWGCLSLYIYRLPLFKKKFYYRNFIIGFYNWQDQV